MSGEKTKSSADEDQVIRDCVDAYAAALATGVVDLGEFLQRVEAPYRQAALVGLIQVDMQSRRIHGENKTVEQYIDEFPGLAESPEQLVSLMLFEFELRKRNGESVSADDYRRRFPNLAELESVNFDTAIEETEPLDYATAAPQQRRTHQYEAGESIGGYKVVGVLGEGATGVVYRCHDEVIRRDVAIKVAHEREEETAVDMEALLHDARTAGKLQHAGIVRILHCDQDTKGRVYIVAECVEGETLKKQIDHGNYTQEQAVRWVTQIADALQYAHKKGVFHRDIKPANILLDEDGNAMLVDFGLARSEGKFFTDDVDRVLGTLAYMSPEQASGRSHWANSQSDIYSLGVVLYELLCGRRPFISKDGGELRHQVIERTPDPPRSIDETIPRELEEVCIKAMSKDPSARYRTAKDMKEALKRCLDEKGPRPLASYGRQFLAAVAALAVTIALVAIWRSRDAQSPNDAPPEHIMAVLTNEGGGDADSGNEGTGQTTDLDGSDTDGDLPNVAIYFQAKDRKFGVSKLSHSQLPLRDGDKVKFRATLSRPGYVYVIWYDAEGQPEILSPSPSTREELRRHAADGEYSSPAEKNKMWNIGGSAGTEMAVLAVSDKPLDSAELEELEQWDVEFNVELNKQLIKVTPNSFSVEPDVERGVTGAVNAVESNPLPDDFMERLDTQFRSYHIFIMRHE